MAKGARILESKTFYEGKVVHLRVDRVIEPGNVEATREVVGHRGSVVVVPRLPDGRVVLVRQFRYAVGKPLWELVAGGLEPGEDPEEAAYRELIEETGYRAGSVRPLCNFYPSPGFLSERMFLFEARDLERRKAQREADERIRLGRFRLDDLGEMVGENRIEDGKTLVGLLWLFRSQGQGSPGRTRRPNRLKE